MTNKPPTAPLKLLSSAEAAELLGVEAKTLETWRRQRRYPLAYVRIGHRCIRYRLADLEKFVSEKTVTPAAAR
jgi:predicted site-specific integrase-resolvase